MQPCSRHWWTFTWSLAVVLCGGASVAVEPADLVLTGGRIVTLQTDAGEGDVEALAAADGRVVFVGSAADAQQYLGPKTRHIDLRGQLAVPGFIESHGHFVMLGRSKMTLDLTTARSWQQIVDQVRRAAEGRPAGEWILGRGWHQSKWTQSPDPNVEGLPLHDLLSQAAPRNPVLLTHASGHMSLANAEAMRRAGVDRDTRSPAGGEILRSDSGEPIGAFREAAQDSIHAASQRDLRQRPAQVRRDELLRALQLAADECLEHGVTSFQDAGAPVSLLPVLRELAAEGRLPVRLWIMIRDSNERLQRSLADSRVVGMGDHHLTVRAIKRSIDGALGSHGAWLLEPYDDLPRSRGLNTSTIESIRRTAELAAKHDYQLCVHAIGDRANRETLDIFEDFYSRAPDGKQLRWRIEHAQHLHPRDIPRFAELGVIASMQGCHATSDGPYVVQRLGYRRSAQGAYVWRSLLDSGALIANGTDAPVEPIDPVACFHASVTRRMADGREFFPEQRMTRIEALRSYTIDAAYAAFEEDLKGSLEPGKLADITVLTKDILRCEDDEILSAKVAYTIVGGEVLFQAK